MNTLLARQVRKYLQGMTYEEMKKLQPFLAAIEDAYNGFDNDRKFMEHSLEISSTEIVHNSEEAKYNATENQRILESLIEIIREFDEEKGNMIGGDIRIQDLIQYLKNLLQENTDNQKNLEILSRAINASNVTVFVWEKNESRTIRYVSSNIEKNFGYSYDDFMSGKVSIDDIIIPEDKERARKERNLGIYSDLKDISLEYRIKNKSGKTMWVREEEVFKMRSMGELGEYEGIIIDISSLKEKQIEIENQKEYLQTMVNSIGEGVMVVDKLGKVKVFNDVATKITGIEGKNIIGYHYKEKISFTDASTKIQYTLIDDCLNNGIPSMVLDNIFFRNIPLSVITSPIKDIRSTVHNGCIVVFRDMTESKKLDMMQKEFLSIASHELRTPMTVINGYAGILLEEKFGPISEGQKKYIDRIQTNTNYLLNLVNDMLNISKLESGTMEMRKSKFDILQLAQETVKTYRHMLTGKSIVMDVAGESIEVDTDKEKVMQVMINLVGNSYKFTEDKGKIHILIKNNGDTFSVSIEDTGIGISEENVSKLFKKFYQVDSHLQRKENGTGLGLSICDLILKQMGGTISVKSTLGKGSTFTFTLPKVLK